MPRNRWYLTLVALMLVLAFQLININTLNMHPDEELSYRATNGTLADTIYFQTSVQDNQAPLWFVSFWAWRNLVGNAEFTSRVFGLLLMALALSIVTQIVKQAFDQWEISALALLVLIGNAFFFSYAFDIRPYPMVMLVAACSTWALQRWLTHGKQRLALIYGLSIALLLYVHYLLAFLVLAHIIYVLLIKHFDRRILRQGIIGGIFGLLIWLPWFPNFVNQVVGLRNIEAMSGTGRGVAGIGVSTQATTLPTLLTLINLSTNGLILLYGIILLIGIVRLWRHKGYRLALTWMLLAPAIYLLVNTIAGVYAPRFVSHALLGMGIALAAGLALLPAWWHRIPLRAATAAVFIGANLLTFTPLIPAHIPFRGLFRHMSAEAKQGDVVLLDHANENDPFQQYMFHTYLSPQLATAMTTDLQTALKAPRVWYITAAWLTNDVQQSFKQLERSHPLQEVSGQCDLKWCYLIQLMQASPNNTPQTFANALPFYGLDQISVTKQSVSARLWWKADVTPKLDYSIALHISDANGTLIAQSDGSINHYNTQTVLTSQMQAGQIYIDYRTIALPENIPSGTYTLSLIVYQSWDNTRLNLTNGDDHLVLQELKLG